MNNQPRYRHHFWGLLLTAGLLGSLGVVVVSYGYATGWAQTVWHLCQDGLQNLWGHTPVTWQLAMLALLLLVLLRGLWSFGRQVWQTYRFTRKFVPLQSALPHRLRQLLDAHHLTSAHLICLDLPAAHAFCLGFWRPRIWLTTGLLNILTDEELHAVLAHEAHHLRRRDPLRLAIGRAIKNAFFFLPIMGTLAHQAELEQELDADSAAIACLGDDLPLLCALQKLLAQQKVAVPLTLPVSITAFNVTEARLRWLIHGDEEPSRRGFLTWRQLWVNLAMLYLLAMMGYLAVQPVMAHTRPAACTIETVVQPLQSQLPLHGWP